MVVKKVVKILIEIDGHPLTEDQVRSLWAERETIRDYRNALEGVLSACHVLREIIKLHEPRLLEWTERWKSCSAVPK